MEETWANVVRQARDGDRAAARAVVESLQTEILALVRGLAQGDLCGRPARRGRTGAASARSARLAALPDAALTDELAFAIACAVRRFDVGGQMRFAAYARHWMRACVLERCVRRELARERGLRSARRNVVRRA
jgi:hypothetical protein